MGKLFYFLTIILLLAWVAGLFSSTTGNLMAIAAVVLSKFTDNISLRNSA